MTTVLSVISLVLQFQVAAPDDGPINVCKTTPPIVSADQAACAADRYFKSQSCVYFGWGIDADDKGRYWAVTLIDQTGYQRQEGLAGCPDITVYVCKASGLIGRSKPETEEC